MIQLGREFSRFPWEVELALTERWANRLSMAHEEEKRALDKKKDDK